MESTDIPRMTSSLGIRVVAAALDANFSPTKMADVRGSNGQTPPDSGRAGRQCGWRPIASNRHIRVYEVLEIEGERVGVGRSRSTRTIVGADRARIGGRVIVEAASQRGGQLGPGRLPSAAW